MTQDLAIPDQQPNASTDLVKWAEQASAAAVLAERICNTQMVPVAYRGKPAETVAAILAGAELGLSPFKALDAFDFIQGTPAPKAKTLRAIVQAAGHQLRVVESTDERAVVDGRRKGDAEWQTSIWDIGRATRMGLTSKDQWKKQPAAMLVARATAEVCRWVASDAIMGVGYAAEEITDDRTIDHAPVARRLTVAELDAAPGPDAELVTREQQKHMFALWGDLGFAGDENREQRLTITAKILGIPELESSNELTYDEADQVIAALRERKERTGAES